MDGYLILTPHNQGTKAPISDLASADETIELPAPTSEGVFLSLSLQQRRQLKIDNCPGSGKEEAANHIHSIDMASLNTSTNGPSIKSSYLSIVNSPPPSGPAANSPTYGVWSIFSVSAPLVNAFQADAGGKESVLKVQATGGRQHSHQHVDKMLIDPLQRANSSI